MDPKRTCSGCQKPLEANAPHGLCPECLLKAGLSTGVDLGPDSQPECGRTPFVAPSPEEVTRLFPHLEILSFVGQGGMGAVYKARQKALDRVVALKILPPGIGKDPSFAQRFAREAKALARLNHPGVVTLYEFGQADGLFFFLMEFVDGMNLRHLLEVERISAREALAIVPQICDALQYAHDQGIVHRDIKPENILLDRQGRVKVADFGLAKLAEINTGRLPRTPSLSPSVGEGASALTDAGKVMGTPQYMAPEQRERPTEVDHRADIYSLGVVFYQMLTGELPCKLVEPPSRKVQVDVRLDEVVLRALEKEPQRRYQQVSEVKAQVETIVATPSSTAPLAHGGLPAGWTIWAPFHPPLVWEICAHMTEAERREATKRGLLFALWNAMTFFGPFFCYKFLPSPINWIYGICILLVGLSFYPLLLRMQREYFCSTAWARQQGIEPKQLSRCPPRMFVVVGRRGGKAVIHWPGVLQRFVLMLVIMEIAAIETSLLFWGSINPVAVLIAFFFACMITGFRIGRWRALPVDRLVSLDGPAAAKLPTKTAPPKSPLCRIFEILFGFTFTSPLAIKLINVSALGFLGALAFLGFVPLPGWHRCFGFAGFSGFFGLIGVAFIVESAQRRKADRMAGMQVKSSPGSGQSAVATEEIQRQVKVPAIGLLTVGILNGILVSAIGVLISWSMESQLVPIWLWPISAHTLLFSGLMMFGALKMKRLESRNWGISAAVLAMVVLPGNLIGLPLGIWALVVLSRPDVRAAFRQRHSPHSKRRPTVKVGKTLKIILVLLALVAPPIDQIAPFASNRVIVFRPQNLSVDASAPVCNFRLDLRAPVETGD